MQIYQLIDIESVAHDVMAAEGWNSSQYERALRVAEQIVHTPEELIDPTGGVARDLPLPLHADQAQGYRIIINRQR